MKYEIFINDKSITIDVEEMGRFKYRVRFGGQEKIVDCHRTEEFIYSVIIDGRSYEVDVRSRDDKLLIEIDGETYTVTAMDEKKKALMGISQSRKPAGRAVICAPMPGRVVKLLKQKGEQIRRDEGILIIEAMKMENELRAESEGVIKELFVNPGDTVEAGQKLVEIG